jgi:chromosomal replication initiation ATPase DnaA
MSPLPRLSDLDRQLIELKRIVGEFTTCATAISRTIDRLTSTDAIETPQKIRAIQEIVATAYAVPLLDLSSKSRLARIVLPRHIAIYLIRELTSSSPSDIAKAFKRNRSSIPHAIHAVTNRISADKTIASQVDLLRTRCREQVENIDLPLFGQATEGPATASRGTSMS